MHIVIGADHAGFHLKGAIIRLLEELGHTVHDVGAYDDRSSDFPDFSWPVAVAVARGEADRGILVCGNGVGVCVAANKVRGVRAGLCHDTLSARQSVEHDDCNVLCLGERIIGTELALEIVRVWLAARFKGLDRYRRRLDKIAVYEAEQLKP